jgi:hypothetical protein
VGVFISAQVGGMLPGEAKDLVPNVDDRALAVSVL